jgi:hypothetical protein
MLWLTTWPSDAVNSLELAAYSVKRFFQPLPLHFSAFLIPYFLLPHSLTLFLTFYYRKFSCRSSLLSYFDRVPQTSGPNWFWFEGLCFHSLCPLLKFWNQLSSNKAAFLPVCTMFVHCQLESSLLAFNSNDDILKDLLAHFS